MELTEQLIQEKLECLKNSKNDFLKLSEDMLRADNKNLYPMDFFCL
jgi:hypothetical protein